MFKKIIVLGVAMVMCIGVLAGCGEKNTEKFYSLQEAYDDGLLTVSDLQSIAYYYSLTVVEGGSNNDENFVPKTKTPETLDQETENNIKKAYFDNLKERDQNTGATIGNILIRHYYGTYGDCVVVNVSDNFYRYDYVFIPEQFIGGVLFRNYCAAFIQVWAVE